LLEYESESETSTGSVLPLYTSLLPLLPPPSLLPSLIDSPSSYYNMSQLNFQTIIRQQQEQLVAMQAQLLSLSTLLESSLYLSTLYLLLYTLLSSFNSYLYISSSLPMILPMLPLPPHVYPSFPSQILLPSHTSPSS